ncbi:MAG TPA: hypothetical protein VGX96_06155 [Candidatus Elarobacter sp.]|nr:hypothetical protein [Candidatus Elarobacter sp.]
MPEHVIAWIAAAAALFLWPSPVVGVAAPYDVAVAVPAPQIFGEGTISTVDDESGGAFSPDGTDFYFAVSGPYTLAPRLGIICVSHFAGGRWQRPEAVSFSGQSLDFPPHLSPDGERMYFASTRRSPSSSARGIRIWVSRKTPAGWGDPEPLPAPVNAEGSWNADPSVTSSGTLYFSSNRGDALGHFHIYRAEKHGETYAEPVKLGNEINSDFNDLQPFVTPDEKIMVFASSGTYDSVPGKRPEELIAGGTPYPREDLYVSENRNGVWSKARHLENGINTFAAENYPSISPDGRYLFFSSERSMFDVPTPHRIGSDEFERAVRSTLNGRGNMYFVDVAALGLGKSPPAPAPGPAPAATEAEVVGEGVISTPDDEFGGSISPDGKTIYFDRSVPAHYLYTMWRSKKTGNRWGKPEMLPFSGRYRDSDPVLSPDGNVLLFASDRPVNGIELHRFSIWSARRNGDGWGTPRVFPGPVNSAGSQVFASMAANGDLYFNSSRGGGYQQVYRSRLVHGVYGPAEKLGPAINSERSYIAEAFIAPDQSYVLLGIYAAPDGYGSYDIYISYNKDGRWSYPINVGPAVNTPAREYSPRVTPDGKYLMFTSERGFGTQRPASPLSYDDFIRGTRGVYNGLGNIYRIEMKFILDSTRPKARY